eukprot:1363829-Rhodomonas_salina.5
MKTLSKAISAHKQYLNPKNLFKRTPSAVAAAPSMESQTEQYEVKPAWKVLGARKLAREAMSDEHESPLVAETQSAVLSNRLAWKVLAHRRNQRLALSDTTNEDRTKDLGCCTKQRKLSVHDFLAELDRTCNEVEYLDYEHASLNTLVAVN